MERANASSMHHMKRKIIIEQLQLTWNPGRDVDTSLVVGHMRLQSKVEFLLDEGEQMPCTVLS